MRELKADEAVEGVNFIIDQIRTRCPTVYNRLAAGEMRLVDAMVETGLVIRASRWEWLWNGVEAALKHSRLATPPTHEPITDADLPF